MKPERPNYILSNVALRSIIVYNEAQEIIF